MDHEVVVVGGGIGGLTVAALLAKRGVDVCLLEKESRVGGCAASFEKFGYSFEQGDGLYTGWKSNEIHDRIFSELAVDPPEVRLLESCYVVRLPDQSEISLAGNSEEFEESLRASFPECAGKAVEFYRKIAPLSTALRRTLERMPDFLSASRSRRAYILLKEGRIAAEILKTGEQSTVQQLEETSARFRRFIDVQLQQLAQATSADVSYLHAALALSAPREGMFAIRGGVSVLAKNLAESITGSGGKIRLDTPVLRLSYDSTSTATGVQLLSGETVIASRGIVSNLTVWDTYGKLIGLNRTSTGMRKYLNALRSWGAYLLYLGMDEDAAASLATEHILTLSDWQLKQDYDPETSQLLFAAAPPWDRRAPEGKRAVTVHAFTDVDEWFTFHKDETDLEERDQQMLELCWGRLHSAMPELGSSVEVIDTVNPRTFYDHTRRKLGMVGGRPQNSFWLVGPSYATSLPNVFIVSDTTYPGGIAALSQSALLLADKLAHP
jgi:phytoene dehydrogenase-like protein